MMLLALAATVFLTWQSVATHDWAAAERQGKIVAKVDIDKSNAGYVVFKSQGCINCHGENLQGGAGAPSLIGTGLKAEEIAKIAKNGRGKMPSGIFKGNDTQLKNLTEFIAGLGKK
jgi:menaquinol-cytochrome c reductase cytochrome b/c subunit